MYTIELNIHFLRFSLSLVKNIRMSSLSVLQRREFDREARIQDSFLQSQNEEYVPNREVQKDLENLCERESQIVLAYGPKGSGKSGMLCNWVKDRRHRNAVVGRKDELVFYHNAGCSRASAEIAELLRRVCQSAEKILTARDTFSSNYEEGGVSETKLIRKFHRILESLSSGNLSIVMVVDGANHLKGSNPERSAYFPRISELFSV